MELLDVQADGEWLANTQRKQVWRRSIIILGPMWLSLIVGSLVTACKAQKLTLLLIDLPYHCDR